MWTQQTLSAGRESYSISPSKLQDHCAFITNSRIVRREWRHGIWTHLALNEDILITSPRPPVHTRPIESKWIYAI
jgi:hypothetical protein